MTEGSEAGIPQVSTGEDNAPGIDLTRLYIVSLTVPLGYGMIFTILAELKNEFGFTDTQVGVIAGAGFLSGLIAQLTLAPQADRGRSRVLLNGGVVIIALAMAAMAVAEEHWQFVGARLLLGFGSGAIGPSIRRIVILTSAKDQLGERLGTITALDLAGFVLGPVVAWVAFEVGGIRGPFVALAVVYVLLIPLTLSLPAFPSIGGDRSPSFLRVLAVPRFRVTIGTAVAFFVAVGYFEALWAILLDDLGSPHWLIALTLSVFVLPMVVLARRGGRTAQQVGPYRVMPYSLGIAAVCMVFYGVVGEAATDDSDTVVWALVVVSAVSLVHACVDAYSMPANMVAVALASPRELLATGQGVFSSIGLLVALFASTGGALLYDKVSPSAAFVLAALVMMAGIAYSVVANARLDRADVKAAADSVDAATP